MAREYTIGQAAELLNLSRDALRFYEKKRLVMPKKKENGYRYYTEEDIRLLLDLICWRKVQCSIEEIQTMYNEGGPAYMDGFIARKIQEEKRQIQEHQKLLRKLNVLQYTIKKIAGAVNQYDVCSMPKCYEISQRVESFEQVRELWFAVSGQNRGLEHCMLHEESLPAEDDENEKYRYQCYLAMDEFSVKKLKLEEYVKGAPSFSFPRCAHTIYEADTEQVDREAIEKMKQWAKDQGLDLTGQVHAHYLWNNQKDGRFIKSYIELYMPVKG